MYPSSPYLYSYEVKAAEASFPREHGTVLLENPLNKVSESILKICYRRYQSKANPESKTKLNLVFFHGTGMNKGLWHYHIDKLYKYFNSEQSHGTNLHLNVVCAFDAVNHADSACLNRDKLGYICDWRDSSKDVVKVLTEDEAATFVEERNKISIMIGHSMGGFVTLYSAVIAPFLFDSCIVVNPVSYVHPDQFIEKDIEFKKWFEKKYMKDNFDIQDDKNWFSELESFFLKESFFRNFHPVVLRNMLEDELPQNVKRTTNQPHKKITLNTTVAYQLHTYWGMNTSVSYGMPTFGEIPIPVFHVVSENDNSSADARRDTRQRLQNVVHAINFPNAKHLVNGEDPDFITKLFILILEERELINKDSTVVDEEYLMKKYGKNYRQVLSDGRLDSIIKNGPSAPKL